MEPGHEDREYILVSAMTLAAQGASMEPGHEDREYGRQPATTHQPREGLNGARS